MTRLCRAPSIRHRALQATAVSLDSRNEVSLNLAGKAAAVTIAAAQGSARQSSGFTSPGRSGGRGGYVVALANSPYGRPAPSHGQSSARSTAAAAAARDRGRTPEAAAIANSQLHSISGGPQAKAMAERTRYHGGNEVFARRSLKTAAAWRLGSTRVGDRLNQPSLDEPPRQAEQARGRNQARSKRAVGGNAASSPNNRAAAKAALVTAYSADVSTVKESGISGNPQLALVEQLLRFQRSLAQSRGVSSNGAGDAAADESSLALLAGALAQGIAAQAAVSASAHQYAGLGGGGSGAGAMPSPPVTAGSWPSAALASSAVASQPPPPPSSMPPPAPQRHAPSSASSHFRGGNNNSNGTGNAVYNHPQPGSPQGYPVPATPNPTPANGYPSTMAAAFNKFDRAMNIGGNSASNSSTPGGGDGNGGGHASTTPAAATARGQAPGQATGQAYPLRPFTRAVQAMGLNVRVNVKGAAGAPTSPPSAPPPPAGQSTSEVAGVPASSSARSANNATPVSARSGQGHYLGPTKSPMQLVLESMVLRGYSPSSGIGQGSPLLSQREKITGCARRHWNGGYSAPTPGQASDLATIGHHPQLRPDINGMEKLRFHVKVPDTSVAAAAAAIPSSSVAVDAGGVPPSLSVSSTSTSTAASGTDGQSQAASSQSGGHALALTHADSSGVAHITGSSIQSAYTNAGAAVAVRSGDPSAPSRTSSPAAAAAAAAKQVRPGAARRPAASSDDANAGFDAVDLYSHDSIITSPINSNSSVSMKQVLGGTGSNGNGYLQTLGPMIHPTLYHDRATEEVLRFAGGTAFDAKWANPRIKAHAAHRSASAGVAGAVEWTSNNDAAEGVNGNNNDNNSGGAAAASWPSAADGAAASSPPAAVIIPALPLKVDTSSTSSNRNGSNTNNGSVNVNNRLRAQSASAAARQPVLPSASNAGFPSRTVNANGSTGGLMAALGGPIMSARAAARVSKVSGPVYSGILSARASTSRRGINGSGDTGRIGAYPGQGAVSYSNVEYPLLGLVGPSPTAAGGVHPSWTSVTGSFAAPPHDARAEEYLRYVPGSYADKRIFSDEKRKSLAAKRSSSEGVAGALTTIPAGQALSSSHAAADAEAAAWYQSYVSSASSIPSAGVSSDSRYAREYAHHGDLGSNGAVTSTLNGLDGAMHKRHIAGPVGVPELDRCDCCSLTDPPFRPSVALPISPVY